MAPFHNFSANTTQAVSQAANGKSQYVTGFKTYKNLMEG